jgi:CPA2 family monovalent cation:H+ antiporter-2
MHTFPFVADLTLLLVAAVVVVTVLSRLRLPAVTGLLVAGVLLGPSVLGLVKDHQRVELLAEVGVVLLLFTIGLEFSLTRLQKIGRLVAIAGLLQVGLTIAATFAVCHWLGLPWRQGLFFGFVVSLSSTALVLRGLSERGELDAPHGRFIVGALIFQDLCVVPMVLLTPMLAGQGGGTLEVALALGKAVAVVVVVLGLGRFVLPKLLQAVDAVRSREVFLLGVLGVCAAMAWLTSLAGLSLALGAFLAGVVLADSDYGERALTDVLPVRDVLASVFFISLGLLFDIRVVLERPLAVAGILFGLLAGKGLIATLSAASMRFPARAAWLAGAGLAQFGEFGFVLLRQGHSLGLCDTETLQLVLAPGVLSMILTPLVIGLAPRITAGEKLLAPLERLLGVTGADEAAPELAERSDHIVVVGLGTAGELLARSLQTAEVPWVGLELNAARVEMARGRGAPVYYGDITSAEARHHLGVARAKAVVLLINDPGAAMRTTAVLRAAHPHLRIIVRCKYFLDRAELQRRGADHVIVEEWEAGVQTVLSLHRWLGTDEAVARNCVQQARQRLGMDDGHSVKYS